jgi:NAD(P)-dependent dehydrogenase (short-subunit alcohol dehydrogenase family)
MTMTKRLEGKVAIITGAGCVGPGWGNGRAAAVIFAREGARVLAVDRDGGRMDETLARALDHGGVIQAHRCDVTDAADVAAMVDACIAAFGRVDILVNNVGGSAPGGPVELSEQGWDAQLDLNVKSVFLTCKAVLPQMERQGSGVIVNVSSMAAVRFSDTYPLLAYSASKAGVNGLTQSIAMQYASKGIRVNAIMPGLIDTEIHAEAGVGDRIQKVIPQVPMGRIGTPEECAEAILWLCSGEAAYTIGAILPMTGGR